MNTPPPINKINKKVDPGWNDPPMLNYNATNPPPKSRIANKRIAFPLNSSGITSNQNNFTTIPQSINLLSSNTAVTERDNKELNLEEIYEKTIKNFEIILEQTSNEEVSQKINIMKDMWNMGNFNSEIKQLIYQISKYIIEKDSVRAKECELELVLKNKNICTSWIVGVRHLINQI